MCYCICFGMQYHKVERGIIPMKNSDMKVIAIILSIALFFTIVTSNAVSIASVVFLAKGQTATEGTVDAGTATTPDAGTATTPNAGTATTPNAGTATTPDATQPAGDAGASTTPDATQPAGDAGTATPDANKPADNAPAADNNPIAKDPLAAYQKATKEINTKGIAGYNKIGWQKPLKIEGLGFLDSVIVPILEGFMTTEDEAEVKVNAKGSDDAKNRMPASNCSKKYIKSATAVKDGSNYKVTIVLVDFTNPGYADPDGLQLMSREFLDYKDVEKTVVEDPTVSKIVKSLEGQIEYKAYTITSEMTADGKFVSITHQGIGYIDATLNGSIHATGELEFNAKYTDFKY